MTKAIERTGKVSPKTKTAFAAGSLEEAVMAAAGIVTMLFYNQVLGVSAYLCGIVFLVASVVDAVSDPFIGAWSDNLRSRWGRRHPFMLAGMLPLCLGFYLLYAPPENASESFYFWWSMGAMSLMRIGKTLFVVPHDALGAELTDDYHERTSIFGFNAVAGMLGASLLAMVVLVVIFPSTDGYENGLLNPDGYPVLAFAGATLMLVMLAISIGGTRDQIPRLHNVNRQTLSFRDNLDDLIALFTSRSYLSVCIAGLVMLVSGGIPGVVSTYTFIYGFDLSTEQLSIQRIVMIPGMFIALPLAAWFTRKFDKKLTVIYNCIICGTCFN